MRLALIPILLLWVLLSESSAAEHIVLIPSQRSLNQDSVIHPSNDENTIECICVPEIRNARGIQYELQICRELTRRVYETGTIIVGSKVENCQKN